MICRFRVVFGVLRQMSANRWSESQITFMRRSQTVARFFSTIAAQAKDASRRLDLPVAANGAGSSPQLKSKMLTNSSSSSKNNQLDGISSKFDDR